MQYTHLGRTGLLVSRLCLGTMNFGPQTTEQDSDAIMDRALEQGINFFDTANRYGQMNNVGRVGATEEIIGRWFAQGGGRRDKVVLATKLYGAMGDWPNEGKLSALNIRRACEASLRRLQTDYIDLYQMHHIDRDTPWEEIWQGMEQLVREGKILYVGSSNFAGWHIAQANEIARSRHFLGLVCRAEPLQPQCTNGRAGGPTRLRSIRVGCDSLEPSGRWFTWRCSAKDEEGRRAGEQVRAAIEKNRAKLEAYEALCRDLGEDPANVGLAWLLHNKVVTAPIIGPRTAEQLDGALRAVEITLSDETLHKLDEIFPGPGGRAPEAYAW